MRVLVVEDEVRLAGAIERGLAAEGFAVDVATDGTDGLWLAGENDYDAIVLDLMLPGVNGYRICRELRSRDDWTPILVLTAKDGEHDHADVLDEGADDFLTKPFSYVVLLAHLRALVRRGRAARPTLLRVGDLEVDPARHTCRRGTEVVPLTPKEFAVLEHLVRRGGEVVSKAELLAHAWDFAFDGDPNVVEVHVSALRRKIDLPYGRSTIRTVRGLGYRVDPEGLPRHPAPEP